MSEIIEDTEEVQGPPLVEREEAFQSAPGDWRTQKLMPFSVARRALFLAWRGALRLPSLSTMLEVHHDAFLEDAIRLVWLSLVNPEQLEQLRYEGFGAMQAACDVWANGNLEMSDLAPITLTGLKIWNNAGINRHAPDVDPDYAVDAPGKSLPSLWKNPCM